jgi:hypothetical protein
MKLSKEKLKKNIKLVCEFAIEVNEYIEAKKIVREFERKNGML